MEDTTFFLKLVFNDNGQVVKYIVKLVERECVGGSWNILRISIRSFFYENQCNKEIKWVWFRGSFIFILGFISDYFNNK